MEKHRLAVWMDGRVSQVAFAERVRCSESFLSNLISGARRPSYEFAKRISEATSGEISIDALFTEAARLKAAVSAKSSIPHSERPTIEAAE